MRPHVKGYYKDIPVWAYWRNFKRVRGGNVAIFTHEKDYHKLVYCFKTDEVPFSWSNVGIDMHKTWAPDDPIIPPLEELRRIYPDLPSQGDEGGFWVTMKPSDFSRYFRVDIPKPLEGDDL